MNAQRVLRRRSQLTGSSKQKEVEEEDYKVLREVT
jgi:hypothetical protein